MTRQELAKHEKKFTLAAVGGCNPFVSKKSEAATRSSLAPDRKRASRAASIVGAATESSAACWTVHLPGHRIYLDLTWPQR